jgi:hypothetical protein
MGAELPQSFEVKVADGVIDRIRARLSEADWTACPSDDENWLYGTDSRWLRELVDHWLTRYDWRTAEAGLNRWPQFRAEVQGIPIHYYHVRGSAPKPRAPAHPRLARLRRRVPGLHRTPGASRAKRRAGRDRFRPGHSVPSGLRLFGPAGPTAGAPGRGRDLAFADGRPPGLPVVRRAGR